METERVRALELIVDWDLYPRYMVNKLDTTNVAKLKEAWCVGEIIPPIIADRKSKRIVDGLHRHKAALSLWGDLAEIDVKFKDYASDMDMFLESARLNTTHGLPLSPKDKVHVIIKAEKGGASPEQIGMVLGLSESSIQKLITNRTATIKATGERIPLAHGAKCLGGKIMNRGETEFARNSNGMLPMVNARLLISALKAKVIPIDDAQRKVLVELKDLICDRLGMY